MKKVCAALVMTNLASLFGLWFYKHNYDGMVSLADFGAQLHKEYLLVTPLLRQDGHTNIVATPTIFRTMEQCKKTESDWNEKKIMPGAQWRCEEYGK